MVDLMWFGVVGLGGIAALALLSERIASSTTFGASVVVAVILSQWEFNVPIQIVSVGGVSVQVLDLIGLALAGAALVNFNRRAGVAPARLAPILVAISALVLVSLLRGVYEFGLGTAVNETRQFLLYIAIGAWVVSIKPTRESVQALDKVIYVSGWLLCALAAYHVIAYGVGSVNEFVDPSTGLNQVSRSLVAGQAFALLLALLRVLGLPPGDSVQPLHRRIAPPVFLLVIVVSQQRSVWAATAASIFVLLVFADRSQRARLLAWAAPAVAVGFLMAAVAAGELFDSLQTSLRSLGTLQGRLASQDALWTVFAKSDRLDQLIGAPFGSGFTRVEADSGRLVEYSPHSAYFLPLLRLGVAGLALYLGLILRGLIRARGTGSAAGMASLSAALVFGWAYALPWYCLLFAAPFLVTGTQSRGTGIDADGRASVTSGPFSSAPQMPEDQRKRRRI